MDINKELTRIAKDITTRSVFEKALKEAIDKKIRELKEDHTTWMSIDNLKQVVKSPSTSLQGAPKGTNAQSSYSQMFKELCRGIPFCRTGSISERKVAGAGMTKEQFSSRVRTVLKGLVKKYGGTAGGTQASGETKKDGKTFKWHATIERQNASNGEVAGILTLRGGIVGESIKTVTVPSGYDNAFKQLGIEPLR